MHIPFFRIFYDTTFTVLSIALALLLLISPADGIYQSYLNDQLWNVLIIAAVYFSTLLIAIFIYATRLYTNRAHLANIPRAWILGDVKKSARRMIVESLRRSASIAYEAHPRDLKEDKSSGGAGHGGAHSESANTQQQPTTPIWGSISHSGWSSPSSLDLPSLQYEPVVLELPHLIEAKAVSLAPTVPIYPSEGESPDLGIAASPLPDALIVELLQRPATMGLRDYITHLTALSVLNPLEIGTQFLFRYEKARFGPHPISESEFRALMTVFAELLRGMKEVDPSFVAGLHAEEDYSTSTETSSIRSTDTVSHTPFHTPMPYSDSFDRTAPRRKPSNGSLADSEGTIRTAPLRQRARRRDGSQGTGSARSRRAEIKEMASMSSLRQVRTNASVGSQRSDGSVIRLAEARTPLDLPYTFTSSGDESERKV